MDSTVFLQWLRSAGEYKQFVANQVKTIHEHPEIIWRHVPTHGPDWLVHQEQWPSDILPAPTPESECEARARKEIFSAAVDSTDKFGELLEKYPLMKATRVIT